MRKDKTKGPWILFLLLLAGVIIGSMLGNVIGGYTDAKLFHESFTIGTQGMPQVLDLSIIKLAFGLSVTINFGTVLGLIIGLIIYFRY